MDRRGPRAALTTIYFLLREGTFSRWHQVASDEVWHLYEGGPQELLELSASGQSVLRHRLAPVGSGTHQPVSLSLPGFGKQRGRWIIMRSSGCQLARVHFADFRLLADDHVRAAALARHCPIWQRSFDMKRVAAAWTAGISVPVPYWV